MVGAAFVANLLLYARWEIWTGGTTWGPRFLVPMMPLLFLPLAGMMSKDRRRAAIVLLVGCLSVLVNLLGVLRPLTNTMRYVRGTDRIFPLEQFARLNPDDLHFKAFYSMAGTFWPHLTWFGVALLALFTGSLAALQRITGRSPRRLLITLGVASLLFVGLREKTVPYRHLYRGLRTPFATTRLPLEAAVIKVNGRSRRGARTKWLHGHAEVSIQTWLSPGVYRLESELSVSCPSTDLTFPYALRIGADTVAVGRLGPTDERRLLSDPVRIYDRGIYLLRLTVAPDCHGRGPCPVLCGGLFLTEEGRETLPPRAPP